MYHYVYIIEDIETEEYYIGSRTSRCIPNEDDYLGSMKSWKPNKNKLYKTIIGCYETRYEAIEIERNIITIKINDPLNRNYYIPTMGFHTVGLKRSKKWIDWNSKRFRGSKNPNFGKYHGLDRNEINNRLDKIKNIDLNKFGWVVKVSKILGITHTQTKRFINKYYMGDYTRNK